MDKMELDEKLPPKNRERNGKNGIGAYEEGKLFQCLEVYTHVMRKYCVIRCPD